MNNHVEKRIEELNLYQDYVCQVPPSKIIPRTKDVPVARSFEYQKPCGAVYSQDDVIHCDRWRDGDCDYITYMGDVPDILKMMGTD